MNEADINQAVADEICKTGRLNGDEFDLHDCVALLDGKVVAVSKDIAGALRALRMIDPNPANGMILEVRPTMIEIIR